MQLASSIVQIS